LQVDGGLNFVTLRAIVRLTLKKVVHSAY